MLEKEPLGTSPELTEPKRSAGAAPGGPSPPGQPPASAVQTLHQYTLQFLIAAIKKVSN
jgi:hypothetical protein